MGVNEGQIQESVKNSTIFAGVLEKSHQNDMSDIVIKVENLSKQYRIGEIGTGTLSHDLNRWWHRVRGKEDPYLKIGETNDRTKKGNSDYVWALRDINFEVKQGEVVGIVGKNGAGKSTLLKILSKVTKPTTGSIKIKGRVASLLEVGTGFHPEMTGRENVFMNGAILGMTRAEIKKKFDAIVDFAGIERYIDTPVKRYSSGMTVRLGFAVAAFLEPEILIVDEVLAVGDAEFQKKCLGKMKDVSGEGRTVLFVSHNMDAVQSLCSKGIYLKNGQVLKIDRADRVVQIYLQKECSQRNFTRWEEPKPGDEVAHLNYARLIDENYHTAEIVQIGKKFGIEYEYEVKKEGYHPIPNVHVFTLKDEYVFVVAEPADRVHKRKVGIHKAIVWFPEQLLNAGSYKVNIALSTLKPVIVHFNAIDALIFDVVEDINLRNNDYKQSIPGVVRPLLEWESSVIEKEVQKI